MEKIVIGRKNFKEHKVYTPKQKALIGICLFTFFLFLYFTELGRNIMLLMFVICISFGYIKSLDANVYHPNITIEIDEATLEYINKTNRQSFCLEITKIANVRLNYIRRYMGMRPVVDLSLEFLMKDDSLYLLSTRGILSQKGDYLKAIEFLERQGIQIYDPYQLRSILDRDSYDFQGALLNRLWQGELK